MAHDDLYARLNLSRDATQTDVRDAFHVIALQLHPDRNGGAHSERFLVVQVAYEVLSDPCRKRQYDYIRRGRGAGHRAADGKSARSGGAARPNSRQHAPASSYAEWKRDVESTRNASASGSRTFEEWKRSLYRALDEVAAGLDDMAPSPQKADLLRTMIDRVESVKAETSRYSQNIATSVVSAPVTSGLQSRMARFGAPPESSPGGAITFVSGEPDDEEEDTKQKDMKPGDDFLAFLAAKKRRHAENIRK